MSLDKKNLERLKQLGQQLPQSLITSEETTKGKRKTKNSQQHPVETEENPEKLFKELINISPDGIVPPHLIARLKEIEAKSSQHSKQKKSLNDIDNEVNAYHSNFSKPQNKTTKASSKKNIPLPKTMAAEYIDFQKLLLEDEDIY